MDWVSPGDRVFQEQPSSQLQNYTLHCLTSLCLPLLYSQYEWTIMTKFLLSCISKLSLCCFNSGFTNSESPVEEDFGEERYNEPVSFYVSSKFWGLFIWFQGWRGAIAKTAFDNQIQFKCSDGNMECKSSWKSDVLMWSRQLKMHQDLDLCLSCNNKERLSRFSDIIHAFLPTYPWALSETCSGSIWFSYGNMGVHGLHMGMHAGWYSL